MHNIPTNIFYIISQYITVFTFPQVKNKPHEGVTKVRLFLGLLAQMQTTTYIPGEQNFSVFFVCCMATKGRKISLAKYCAIYTSVYLHC
jgi:hypothetical protein